MIWTNSTQGYSFLLFVDNYNGNKFIQLKPPPPTSSDDTVHLCFQKDLFVLREIQSAFQMDSLNSSHPLSLRENDIQTPSEIIELFDDVTHSKVGMTSQYSYSVSK